MPLRCRSRALSTALGLVLVLTAPASVSAQAATSGQSTGPSPKPFLRIEAGGHLARLVFAVDGVGRYLVTGSNDKTVRVWDLRDGRLLDTLRIPIGGDQEGRVYAVAISPDSSLIAAAGWTGFEWDRSNSIYLFERSSGRLLRRLTSLPNVIFHLAFSRDGRHLAATLGGANGVRVYRAADWQQVAEDRSYADASYSADFGPDGRLVTTSYDGFVRLYRSDFSLAAKERAPGGQRPFSAVFSPDGQRLAVGFSDSRAVNVLSGQDLRLEYAPDTARVNNGSLSKVAWSADGQVLYAGSQYEQGGRKMIRAWQGRGRGSFSDLDASADSLMGLRPLPQGGIVYGAADPVVGILDTAGRKVREWPKVIADYRNNQVGFLLSRDGRTVQFAFENWGKNAARFDIGERRLTLLSDFEKTGSSDLRPPRTQASALAVTGMGTDKPMLDGKVLPVEEHETSWSLAVTPDDRHFLLGTDWHLRYFDHSGKQLWVASTPSAAWAVNITASGDHGVAALGDGTIRWYRLSDGLEVLALFPHADLKRWILWNRDGFFDASPGGEALIGYHMNRDVAEVADFVRVEQIHKLFYRPDLVARHLDGDSPAIQAALSRIGDVRSVLSGGLPPEVELVGPPELTLNRRDFTLQVRLADRGGGTGRLVYRVNGVATEVPEARPADISPPGVRARSFTFSPGENVVTVTAYNARGTIESPPVTVKVRVEDPKAQPASLHVLAVGITKYRDAALELKYGASDAETTARELARSAGPLFKSVHVKVLTESQATWKALEAEFLRMARQVKESDVFVVYFAGHGRSFDGEYYFVPWEVRYVNEAALRRGSIGPEQLQGWLANIRALKSVVILDTCYSGSVLAARNLDHKGAIDRLMRATGRVTIASASSAQIALEGHRGHGFFTWALLEGLRGQADARGNRNGVTEIQELADFVSELVPDLTKQRFGYEQVPMYEIRGQFFPIGVAR
jgi:WD40 repeat protein